MAVVGQPLVFMNSNEIRGRFLKFFEDRGHTIVRSSPLIPAQDPTLLFANAGMNQFKDIFLGLTEPPYGRAASCQKCVRAGGKHNDLDLVGHTHRHQTFFEMLGNFSFGDYFKKDAIEYAWTLLREDFDLPADRLWVTVFREDDEAFDIWHRHVGLSPDRIRKLDETDNFWQMGETGPCGPCSELHYDLGPQTSELGHDRCEFPCDCGRYLEIWNLVFMQFNREPSGVSTPLPKPAVDTGMGLERIASVLEGKSSNFDTDLVRPLIGLGSEILGVEYGAATSTDVALRIVADHVRAATFLVSDGVMPSNEGRGYVLRKIMRRGIRQGTLLGNQEPFLYRLTGYVVSLMKDAYPELVSTREYVARIVKSEEERFSRTVAVGLQKLEEICEHLAGSGSDVIPGTEIFKLYDTYGLPLDFTREIADEKTMRLDLAGFEAELERQRERARQSWKAAETRVETLYRDFLDSGPTRFLGYEVLRSTGRVLEIICNGQSTSTIEAPGTIAEIVLDQTPFYAEAGGQVGDTGSLTSPSGAARVLDTHAPVPDVVVHKVRLEMGRLSIGDEVAAAVDEDRRRRVAANHTGTHLLHAALRETLGVHVKQAGSLVAPERLRFDYTHFAPLTDQESQEIEGKINRIVFENHPVSTEVMNLDQAIQSGALAFFGEKYQQRVRVVSVPQISTELCGGTHTRLTGNVGMFKIVSDTSIASGVRRIEALTGFGTYTRLEEDENLIDNLSQLLRSPRSEVTRAVSRLVEEQRQLEHELNNLKRTSTRSLVGDLVNERTLIKNVSVIARRVEAMDTALMRDLAETVRSKMGSGVVVLGQASDGKASLVAAVSRDLEKQLHAGKIIRRIAKIVGGSGGGRADFAQAGGKDIDKLEQALQAVYNIVAEILP